MFKKLRKKIADLVYPEYDTEIQDLEFIVMDHQIDNSLIEDKELIDLTREALKLHPVDIQFIHDEGKYEDKQFQHASADVLDNEAYKYEFNRIIHECVMYIAMESPNETSSTFNRGCIDGLARLQGRLSESKIKIEQERLNRREKKEAEEE